MRMLPPENIERLVKEIKEGKTVVFPTETSYGLGCDAANQQAVDRVFFIKGRPSTKPLLVVVENVEKAKKLIEWNPLLDQIAKKYWPGPLTMVGDHNKKEPLAKGVVGSDGTVAVRVPADAFLNKLTAAFGGPIVATSANISEEGNIYNDQAIVSIFSKRVDKPDIIVEAGELPHNKPTTIARVREGHVEIIRDGEIKIDL